LPIWNYFGYDEPNYTYAANGQKLLGELAALSPQHPYVRVHNLFTTGEGSSSLKWGSTNIYTEDAAGNPVYSWTILDRIFDTFHKAGVKPLVEIGFIVMIFLKAQSSPAGPILPRIIRSGRKWFFNLSVTCASAMAMRK
jgi:hypothetical protein